MERLNFCEIYRSKDREDLASQAFEITTKFGNYGRNARNKGASDDVVNISYDLDVLIYDYGFRILGINKSATRLNRSVRNFLKPYPSETSVSMIYIGITCLYHKIIAAELFEMIPIIIEVNRKLLKVIQQCVPNVARFYFSSPHPGYLEGIAKKAAKKISNNANY